MSTCRYFMVKDRKRSCDYNSKSSERVMMNRYLLGEGIWMIPISISSHQLKSLLKESYATLLRHGNRAGDRVPSTRVANETLRGKLHLETSSASLWITCGTVHGLRKVRQYQMASREKVHEEAAILNDESRISILYRPVSFTAPRSQGGSSNGRAIQLLRN